MTVKPCNRPAVETQKLEQVEFIDVFFIHYNTLCLVCFSQMLGEMENKILI